MPKLTAFIISSNLLVKADFDSVTYYKSKYPVTNYS